MKKIISMLCVVAMMLSFVAISANASGEKISLVANDAKTTDTKLAFDVVIECAEGIKASTVQVKYDGFLTNNSEMTTDDFSAETVSGATAKNVTAQNFITTNYNDMSQSSTTVTLCTIYVEKANFKNDAAFYFTTNSQINGVKSYATAGLEIEAPVSVKTIAVSDSVAVTTDAAATDCQIGTGIGLTANAGEAVFTKMIWALTSGENKLFSKVIELPGISGEFKVAATFINGSHNEKFDVEVVESVAIDAVNAIFTDGTADYFTDATDAALKAE